MTLRIVNVTYCIHTVMSASQVRTTAVLVTTVKIMEVTTR